MFQRKKPEKRKLGIYFLLLSIVILLLCSLRLCSHKTVVYDSVRAGWDTLEVAVEYSPMSMYIYDDTLGGFNLDMLKDISHRGGLSMKFHPVVSIAEMLDGLKNGKYDMVVADIPRTLDGDTTYVFTEPVWRDKQVLVQLRDSAGNVGVTSQLDLAEKTVWIPNGSTAAGRLQNLSSEIGDTIYVECSEMYGPEQLVMLVASGDVPLAVVSSSIARKMSKEYPQLDIAMDISFTQFHSWIVRGDVPGLKKNIDSLIVDFKESKAYKKLVKRYNR